MSQFFPKSPSQPKSHFFAFSGIAAALGVFLVALPSMDAEAKRVTIPLELTSVSKEMIAFGKDDLSADPLLVIQDSASGKADSDILTRVTSFMAKPDQGPLVVPIKEGAPEVKKSEWTSVTVKSGDTLSTIFQGIGLPASTLHSVINSSKDAKDLSRIRVGQVFDFKLDDNGELLSFRSKRGALETITVERAENGFTYNNDVIEPDLRRRVASGVVNDTLSGSAQDIGIPRSLMGQLTSVFGYDIDFARQTRKGDRFDILYEEKHVDGKVIGTGNILAARYVNGNSTYTAVRYTNAAGNTNYYRQDGTSMKRAFIRTPVESARISSRYNPNRRHPVLNKIRAHKGVDYAAPTGTPIKASGDGRIVHVGNKGGYGRTIVIKHGNTYQTLYAHMHRYANGMKVGTHVKQNQVIGYVGSTGLATGPHLHYEFLVNGRHVDPLGIKLPAADPISASEKSRFLSVSNQVMASLDHSRTNQLAMLD